ncbi:hypothetical protein [Desulfosarcina sp. BuS5]|uniref:hypothetical protein n=1 Tax=Desulfosarcina sp. BuS5 TaxID=933262 RepID=UPI0012F93B3C|nr:hypothetical protein [Desulfosarcina sp. BuS5]
MSDDAPQFKKLTEGHALCWIHEGRHYHRLSPLVPFNVDELKLDVQVFDDELAKST